MKYKKMMKIYKTTILKLILILSILLTLFVIIIIWNAKSLESEFIPMPFKIGIALVKTDSMEEELSVNDLVIIKETNDYIVNDIVAYQDDDKLVIHRIISIDGDNIITKGDNNDDPDTPITINKIKGEIIGVYPKLGLFIRTIKSPIGSFILLMASAALIVISFLADKDINKSDNNDSNKQ